MLKKDGKQVAMLEAKITKYPNTSVAFGYKFSDDEDCTWIEFPDGKTFVAHIRILNISGSNS